MKISIQMPNSFDYSRNMEKLDELAKDLRRVDPSLEVEVIPPVEQRGYGVTWWEVIRVTFEVAGGVKLLHEITKASINWAKQTFPPVEPEPDPKPRKRRKVVHQDRPKSVTIYGPHGEILEAFVVYSAEGDPEFRTPAGGCLGS